MYRECHAHIFMNGQNYREAVNLHKNGPVEGDIRQKFEEYRRCDISYIRDGGDDLGVSNLAREIAGEYGIEYRTPIFAIHKNGHYGKIVGRGFDTLREYQNLVLEAKAEGADFIKIMISGIMDFSRRGALTEAALDEESIRSMILIAHEEGMSVMAHANGSDAVLCAVEAGVDSVEHGNFLDDDCLQAMAEHKTFWVPTFVTIANLYGSGRFPDEGIQWLTEHQSERIRTGYEMGISIAPGSDAGAFCVPHGQGTLDEYERLMKILGAPKSYLDENADRLAKCFRRE